MDGSTAKSTVYHYAWIMLLALARFLPDFCARITYLLPMAHGLWKAEPRVNKRSSNPCENKVSYIAGRFQIGDKVVERLPDSCQTLLETQLFLCLIVRKLSGRLLF
jgi:hypothetical protein